MFLSILYIFREISVFRDVIRNSAASSMPELGSTCHDNAWIERFVITATNFQPCSGPSCLSPPTEFPTEVTPPSSTFGPPITNNPPHICLSEWGPWGQCSSPCGTAIKLRTRECRCADPVTGVSACNEMLTISQLCTDLPPCRKSSYHILSVNTNHVFFIYRYIIVSNTDTTTSPVTTTTASVTETAATTTLAPPMGSWGPWGGWNSCPSECGKTTATSRRRQCSGISVCYGKFQEFQPCPFIACPGKSECILYKTYLCLLAWKIAWAFRIGRD